MAEYLLYRIPLEYITFMHQTYTVKAFCCVVNLRFWRENHILMFKFSI